MKKVLFMLNILSAAFLFTSCGGTPPPTNPFLSLGENEYGVQVLYPNGKAVNSSSLYVMWCDGDLCYRPQQTDSNGFAKYKIESISSGQLDIHLSGIPEGYTYNANIYTATPENKEVTITLTETNDIDKGDGTLENPYQITEATYVAKPEAKDTYVYYSFAPDKGGKFTIESWAYNASSFTTSLAYYGNNPQYIPETPMEEVSTGGLKGNFKYEVQLEADAVGQVSFLFGVKASLKMEIPFNVSYTGELTEKPEVTTIYPTRTLTKFEDNTTEAKLTSIPMDGSVTIFYDEANDRFHINDINGPLVLIKLNVPCDYIDLALSEIEEKSGVKFYLLKNGKENYSEFVKAYSNACNSDGVYPANNDLKTFLELLIRKEFYFDERRGNWIGGQLDYTAVQELQWLFPACYYAN